MSLIIMIIAVLIVAKESFLNITEEYHWYSGQCSRHILWFRQFLGSQDPCSVKLHARDLYSYFCSGGSWPIPSISYDYYQPRFSLQLSFAIRVLIAYWASILEYFSGILSLESGYHWTFEHFYLVVFFFPFSDITSVHLVMYCEVFSLIFQR